ncbi:MAG: nitroreductase family protein [Actinomycetota bacterium]
MMPDPSGDRADQRRLLDDFGELVRARRMVRNFRPELVPRELLDELLALALRAPSAGNTWGTHFVVLEGADVAAYWDVSLPSDKRDDFPWPGLLHAPVLVLPCGDADAYVARYAERDKARTGLGAGREAWPIPYWHVDTAMATMTLLHGAAAAGLGGLFFGQFEHETALCQRFDIPASVRPIGTVALGWPAETQRPSQSASRGVPTVDEMVHRGAW